MFAANTSCILTPTVTDGPYYVWGEVIRQNVKEDLYSDGVDMSLEVQYIDINTCRPVPGALVDIWHANATGVYRYAKNRSKQSAHVLIKIVESRNLATMLRADGIALTCAVFSKPTKTVL